MCACVRHDLAELLIRLKQFDKAEKLLKMFLDQEQKGLFVESFIFYFQSSFCSRTVSRS